jgi:hypothetical protein
MKRGWLMGLIVLVGLALAAPAMSADLSATGYMGIGYRAYQNVGAWNDHVTTEWVQRFELFFHAKASEDLKGVVRFRMDSVPNPWGTVKTEQNSIGYWGSEQVSVEVKEAYLDFKIPGIQCPTWVRAGVQFFSLRPEVFLLPAGPGISFRSNIPLADGTLGLSGGWGKIREYDDTATWNATTGRPGADAQSANLFFLAGDYKAKAGISGGLYVALDTGERKVRGASMDKGNVWWIGLYSDGKVGPVNYNLDVIYNTGKEDYSLQSLQDIKYNGWLARVVLTYPYQNFNFGFGGLYVSGVNWKKFDEKGKYTGFVLPPGTETFGPNSDSLIVLSGWGTGPGIVGDIGWWTVPRSLSVIRKTAMDLARRGWPGVWGVRLFADYKALQWLTLSGQVAYWGDTEKYGNALEGVVMDKKYDDKDIGVEVNLGAKIDIYKNLAWRLVFGYLFAGSAADGKTKDGGKKYDDPYAFVSTLIYTF